ncbi:MAG: hypothetical protein DRJ52_08305, partial [Thermoprotei archaeon]
MGEAMKSHLVRVHDRLRKTVLKRLLYEPKKQIAFSFDLAPLGPQLVWMYIPTKGIRLGKDEFDREVYINPLALRAAHGIVVGPTGAGKSLFVKHVLYQLPSLGINFMVFDPHSDYPILVRKLGGEVIDVRKTMFKVKAVFRNPDSRELFIKAVAALFNLSKLERASLREAIKKSRNFSEVLEKLPPGLRSELEYPFSFISRGEVDLDHLLEEKVPFSIDLASMRLERPVMAEVASIVARLAIDEVTRYFWKHRATHRPRFYIVADEFHRILAKPVDLALEVLQETRKIGVYLIAVSQSLTHFSSDYFKQVGFIVALTLDEESVEQLRALCRKTITEVDEIFITTSSPTEEFFPEKALLVLTG